MPKTYNRIISLVPSLTELIIDLGLKDKLIGRTRFCVHPKEAVENIPIIGGTKNPRIDKIMELNPDLIIANKEENRQQDIQMLREECPVEVTDIPTIKDALLAIHRLGKMLGVQKAAEILMDQIDNRLAERPKEKPIRTAYFIWKDPWMSIGGDTYIHDVMEHWNLVNVCAPQNRYPSIPPDELADYNPELVLLSSEPYPFKEKHIPAVKEVCPNARVLLVEGEWFSWYGSRMKHAFERLNVWREAIA
jgi:ABC-type Fe3+-hydroxamate transport system substrate-binding protein